jgi:hypothetical protein
MKAAVPIIIVCILFSLGACASLRHKQAVEEGIEGQVIPVDKSGEQIERQNRESIVINLVPLKNGSPYGDRSITENPDSDGRFLFGLKPGVYKVEIFLQGFYVESFQVTLETSQIIDLGLIRLKKIESAGGKPIKGETGNEVTLSEGDVNIQPPAQ